MALSDWDMIAFDDEANCCVGLFEANGDTLEIRKNNLWFTPAGSQDPLVDEPEGHVQLGSMQVDTCYGRQDARYVYATADGKRFAGLGCYSHDFDGVRPATLTDFIQWLRGLHALEDFQRWVDRIEAAKHLRVNQGDAYIALRLNRPIPATPLGEAEQPILLQMISRG